MWGQKVMPAWRRIFGACADLEKELIGSKHTAMAHAAACTVACTVSGRQNCCGLPGLRRAAFEIASVFQPALMHWARLTAMQALARVPKAPGTADEVMHAT